VLKKIIFFSLFLLFALCILPLKLPVQAIFDPLSVANNKFGIHVFDAGEIDKAAELVNNNGGAWGYVTVPIRADERNLEKWTTFMTKCREKKVIPILRIASFAVGEHWMAPNEWDLVDFANFLDELPWPIKNRYVIVYNEPNQKNEWGGFLDPAEYARVLDRAADIFHKKNADFFVISAGMDDAAPNGPQTIESLNYLRQMNQAIPGIFSKVDGISAHAYGNPAFSTAPNLKSKMNITSYRFVQDQINAFGVDNLRLFLTEVGWNSSGVGEERVNLWYQTALKDYWIDEGIVAITPFVLEAHDGPFRGFSFVRENGSWTLFAKTFKENPKTKGQPQMAEAKKPTIQTSNKTTDPQPENKSNIYGSFWNLLDLIWKFLKIKQH